MNYIMSHFAHHTHYEGYPSHENSLRVDTSVEPRREYRGVTRISNLIVENDQLKRKLQHQNSSLASVNAEIAKYDTVVEENTQLKLQNQFLREQIKNNSAMQNPLKANDKLLKEIESLREELGTVKGKKDRLDIMYDGAKKDINTLKDSIKKYEDIIERKDDKIVQFIDKNSRAGISSTQLILIIIGSHGVLLIILFVASLGGFLSTLGNQILNGTSMFSAGIP